MRRVVWLALLAACGRSSGASLVGGDPSSDPIAREVTAAVYRRMPAVAPHRGAITQLAVASDGSAAVTADAHGGLRVWPALDGSREPVALRGPSPRGLAIVRDGDGLAVAVVDAAGSLTTLHLDADGLVDHRAMLAPDGGFAQVLAAGGVFLARGRDNVIARVDAQGRMTARLLLPPGQQIAALVARGRGAVAVIAPRNEGDGFRTLQTIAIEPLRWGTALALPEPLIALAFSPSGERIAGISARNRFGVFLDAAGEPRIVATDIQPDRGIDVAARDQIGFLDDDHVVFPGGTLVDWERRAMRRFEPAEGVAALGYVDGRAFGPHGSWLAIAEPTRTRYLGYGHIEHALSRAAGELVAVQSGDAMLWLDGNLRTVRSATLGSGRPALALDERRVARLADRSLVVQDVVTGRTHTLGTLGTIEDTGDLAYDGATHVIAIHGGLQARRIRITADNLDEIRPLRVPANARVQPLDPDATGGVSAVAYAEVGSAPAGEDRPANNYFVVQTFREAKDSRPEPLAPATSTMVELGHTVPLGIDDRGAAYFAGGSSITGFRDGARVLAFAQTAEPRFGIVRRDGGLFVLFEERAAIAFDADGVQRWRVVVFADDARFTSDQRSIVVSTTGGLVSLDADTGARIASGCGWSFGLYDHPTPDAILGPVVCVEER